VRELATLSRVWSPNLVFLCETRQNKNKMRLLRNKLGLKGFVGFSSVGLSGGLALFWHENVSVEIQSINERVIDAYVRLSPNAPRWRLTCVYGEPHVENRHRMWDMLRNLSMISELPWLVIGDFNEAFWPEEHLSFTPRSPSQMDAFREVLSDCNLIDLGFAGLPYTYDNNRKGQANVKVRLDRAVASPEWRDMFAESHVQHLVSPVSDHCPILLNIEKEVRTMPRGPRRQYEIFWERAPELSERVADAWRHAGAKHDLSDIMLGLDSVMTTLQDWSKRKFGNILKELSKARKHLETLRLSNADQKEIRKATDHMNELLYKEELLWIQRSRIS
jgi:exonuclease III